MHECESHARVRVVEAYSPYWYLSCTTAHCTAKVHRASATSMKCASCGAVYNDSHEEHTAPKRRPQPRYRLKLKLVDAASDRIFHAVFFGPICDRLFGTSCPHFVNTVTASVSSLGGGKSVTETVHTLVGAAVAGVEFSATFRAGRGVSGDSVIGRSIAPCGQYFVSIVNRVADLTALPSTLGAPCSAELQHQVEDSDDVSRLEPEGGNTLVDGDGQECQEESESAWAIVDLATSNHGGHLYDSHYLSGALSTACTDQSPRGFGSNATEEDCASMLAALVRSSPAHSPADHSPNPSGLGSFCTSTPSVQRCVDARTPSLFSPTPPHHRTTSTRRKTVTFSVLRPCTRPRCPQSVSPNRTLQLFEDSPPGSSGPSSCVRPQRSDRKSARKSARKSKRRSSLRRAPDSPLEQTLQLFEDSPRVLEDLSQTIQLFSPSPKRLTKQPLDETIQLFPHLDQMDKENAEWLQQKLFEPIDTRRRQPKS